MPGANAYACPSPAHCFRTLNVRYSEPATAANTDGQQAHGVMSFIKVVRMSDGAEQTFDGNSDHIEVGEDGNAVRVFGITALVGEVYVVKVVGPDGKEEWQPEEVKVYFGDGVSNLFYPPCSVLCVLCAVCWLPTGNWDKVGTYLSEPSWNERTTYYFRTSFSLTNSACFSHLLLQMPVNDGVIVYINNREVLRLNMPLGDVSNATSALSKQEARNDDGFIYTEATVELPGAPIASALTEGVNVVAAEVHLARNGGWDVSWALRLSALLTTEECSGGRKAPEVCDGIDNDFDGKVDVNAAKKPLQRPCTSACGTGVETCTRGAFQGCSAPKPKPEICNGVDDNCDGLIDNGPGRLNCALGTVCYQGKCVPQGPLTVPSPVFPSKASGWRFHDKGSNMNSVSASWTKGDIVGSMWGTGAAPFGTFPANASLSFATALRRLPSSSATRYFLRSFVLSAADAASTYAFEWNVRRADGSVLYLNGEEVERSNMPDGDIAFDTRAAADSSSTDPDQDNNAVRFYQTYAYPWTGPLAQAGVNWVAVELHEAEGAANSVFDMNMTRHTIQPCSALPKAPKACVRNPPTDIPIIWGWSDDWAYLDASSNLPPANWNKPTFSHASWKTGPAPLGNEGWDVRTTIATGASEGNGRRTYYFRKVVTLPDGKCYFRLLLSVLGQDGLVVYINGAEAGRSNMPLGPITSATPARTEGPWDYRRFDIAGGFLRTGSNLIAVEVHEALDTSTNYFFDLELLGQREAVSCLPLPSY
ncbi:unnamed protein product [Closterium sp. NIES-53]